MVGTEWGRPRQVFSGANGCPAQQIVLSLLEHFLFRKRLLMQSQNHRRRLQRGVRKGAEVLNNDGMITQSVSDCTSEENQTISNWEGLVNWDIDCATTKPSFLMLIAIKQNRKITRWIEYIGILVYLLAKVYNYIRSLSILAASSQEPANIATFFPSDKLLPRLSKLIGSGNQTSETV